MRPVIGIPTNKHTDRKTKRISPNVYGCLLSFLEFSGIGPFWYVRDYDNQIVIKTITVITVIDIVSIRMSVAVSCHIQIYLVSVKRTNEHNAGMYVSKEQLTLMCMYVWVCVRACVSAYGCRHIRVLSAKESRFTQFYAFVPLPCMGRDQVGSKEYAVSSVHPFSSMSSCRCRARVKIRLGSKKLAVSSVVTYTWVPTH